MERMIKQTDWPETLAVDVHFLWVERESTDSLYLKPLSTIHQKHCWIQFDLLQETVCVTRRKSFEL